MKTKKVAIKEDQFQPFVLELRVESKEEAQALYAIFNHTHNSQLLDDCDAINETLGPEYYVGADEPHGGVIANGIIARDYYDENRDPERDW